MAVGMLASALVSLVVEKAANPVLQQFGARWGSGKKMEKLRRALLAIRSMLGDAEERQVKDPAVRDWLAALKGAAYDAEDILDEFSTEVLRRKAEIQNDTRKKVREFFSFRNPVLFRHEMGKKLNDIVERIDDLLKESERFNFTVSSQPQTQDWRQTHSYVDETEVIGRDDDKERVVNLLLAQSETRDVTVLPIVGMGGLGKTTLAQLVYNDERVREHFQLHMWVCVSDSFDVAKLAKEIAASGTGSDRDLPSTMDLLQRRLREMVSQKRYLLVLDDVWNEDPFEWERLKTLINCGKEGSVIIVTTRSEKVSSVMGTLTALQLSCLPEDDSWTLFERRAFAPGAEQRPELVRIGKEIVGRCQGLPLAVKALGCMLRTETEDTEWLAVLRSEIWNIQAGESQILPALRVSYNRLPSHLKQCFAFCATFPKDWKMEKEKLIQLWMAHGFIPSEGNVELEVRGHKIFNELVSRSFFQDVQQMRNYDLSRFGIPKHDYPSKTTCKMHDLVHDLAQSIMKNECFAVLGHAHLDELSGTVRHASIHAPSRPLDVDHRILNKFPTSIRTFLFLGSFSCRTMTDDVDLSKLPSLRALEFHGWNAMELLNAIAPPIYLRYLDLSYSDVEVLPESISRLYNLQTLILSSCSRLRMLPEDMRRMTSLRHVYLDRCESLTHMPAGIGQLSCLQTLTKYIVGSEAGSTITELKCLNLCGALEIYNLKNLSNPADAREANMSSKKNLHSLAFCWGVSHHRFEEDDELQPKNSEEVLEALRPHSGLKMLVLWSYHGVCFPRWMMAEAQLQNLVEISLEGCRHCEKLPPLWQLPSLEVLSLRRLDAIKHICSNTTDRAGSTGPFQAFPSLKRLELKKMENLEAWWEGEGRREGGEPLFFPHLVDLCISDCPKLASLPRLPASLQLLRIDEHEAGASGRTQSALPHHEVIMSLEQLKSIETLIMSGDEGYSLLLNTSTRELYIVGCSNLTSLPEGMQGLTALKISNCSKLTSVPMQLGCLASLEQLVIWGCRSLTSLPEGMQGLTALRTLKISDCSKLTTMPMQLGCLASLEELHIEGCSSLTSLPEGMQGLTALKHLTIIDCPQLTLLPEGLRQRLPSIQRVEIEGCPELERRCKRKHSSEEGNTGTPYPSFRLRR